jgi:site-specific DNA recombinase
VFCLVHIGQRPPSTPACVQAQLCAGAARLVGSAPHEQTEEGEIAPTRAVTMLWSPRPCRVRRTVMAAQSDTADHLIPMRAGTRKTLLITIAKARRWLGELSSHRVTTFEALSAREGCSEGYVRSILPLAFLAPEVVRAAVDGRLPDSSSVSRLAANSPTSWDEQKRVLGRQRSATI